MTDEPMVIVPMNVIRCVIDVLRENGFSKTAKLLDGAYELLPDPDPHADLTAKVVEAVGRWIGPAMQQHPMSLNPSAAAIVHAWNALRAAQAQEDDRELVEEIRNICEMTKTGIIWTASIEAIIAAVDRARGRGK